MAVPQRGVWVLGAECSSVKECSKKFTIFPQIVFSSKASNPQIAKSKAVYPFLMTVDALTIDKWATEVLSLCPELTKSDVLVDLRKTQNVEQTIGRIFDGQFLEGTYLDPSYNVILSSELSPPRPLSRNDYTVVPPTPFARSHSFNVASASGSGLESVPAFSRSQSFSAFGSGTGAREREEIVLVEDNDEDDDDVPPIPPPRGNLWEQLGDLTLPNSASLDSGSDTEPLTDSDEYDLIDLSQDEISLVIEAEQYYASESMEIENAEDKTKEKRTNTGSKRKTKNKTQPVNLISDSDDDVENLLNKNSDVTRPLHNVGNRLGDGTRQGKSRQQEATAGDTAETSKTKTKTKAGNKDIAGDNLIVNVDLNVETTTAKAKKVATKKKSKDTTHIDASTDNTQSSSSASSSNSLPKQNSNKRILETSSGSDDITPVLNRTNTSDSQFSVAMALSQAVGICNTEEPKVKRKKKDDDGEAESAKRATKRKTSAEKEKEKSKKELKREAALLEKQRQKEEKAAQKRQQAEAKKAYQKVNTIRTKTDCVKEMIVDIIPSFASDEEVQLLAASLKESGVEVNVLDSGEEQLKYLNWRRKVTREWEEEEECWVPCSQRVEDENWVLVRLGAGEMAKIVGESGLVPYHQNIKRRFDEKQVIYLIEGFESWCKRRNKRRGKEESESESSDSDAGKGKGKGKKPKAKGKGRTAKIEPTVDEVEDDMLELQIEGGGVRIHQSKNFKESVEWIGSFTDQISLVPELKSEEAYSLNHADKIKSGSDPADTYIKMLEQIQMCTTARAKAIASVYPSLQSLYKTYCGMSEEQGKMLLSKIKCNSGTVVNPVERSLGPQLSRRVWTVVMGEDPDGVLMGGE